MDSWAFSWIGAQGRNFRPWVVVSPVAVPAQGRNFRSWRVQVVKLSACPGGSFLAKMRIFLQLSAPLAHLKLWQWVRKRTPRRCEIS
jgi:hypothetical protein